MIIAYTRQMSGLLTFIAVLAAIVWLVRYLRQRELDAFLDQDLSVLEEMDLPKAAQAHVASTATTARVSVETPEAPAAPTAPEFTLRDAVLDDLHRNFLGVLETVIGDRYRIFVQMPLTDFVRVDGSTTGLFGRSISFLVCQREAFSVAFGIALRGAGQSELARFRYLEDVFAQIGKPLVSFPMIQEISVEEVREALEPLLAGDPERRECPKCGQEMVIRRAARGANAGKTFWVCKEFPDCRGVLRIDLELR